MSESLLAKQILENPLFHQILGKMKMELFELWGQQQSTEEREKLFYQYQGLEILMGTLIETLESKTDAKPKS